MLLGTKDPEAASCIRLRSIRALGRACYKNQIGFHAILRRRLPGILTGQTVILLFAEITKGWLLHSDQGWHYQHKQYRRMLIEKVIKQSMRRKGNCYDNSVMENFFGHLKSELLYLQEFDSIEHVKAELIDYIDYYNRRIKARLKGLPPALHRQQALSAT